MSEITQQTIDIQQALSPLMAFVDEIKNLRRSRKISEESSLTAIGLLTLEIKEDVISTVRSMQIEESKKLSDLEETFKESLKDLRDKLYDQSQTISNLEMDYHSLGDMIARQGGYIENQNKNFDAFRKDLAEKASNNDLVEVKKNFKRYTPISDYHHLSNQVLECASKTSVDSLKKDLLHLEKRVKIYTTHEEMGEEVKNSEERIKSFVESHYLLSSKFNEEKDVIVSRFNRLEEEIQGLYQQEQNNSELVKKKFKEVFELIKRRPWDSDVQHLQGQIDECSTKNEFQTLRNYVNPKIDGFAYSVGEMLGKVYQFEKIIERYDEIILDKASKDDVKQILAKLPSFALGTQIKELAEKQKSETLQTNEKLSELQTKTEDSISQITVLIQRIEAIRRENIEVTSIASTLLGFSEKISEKADKSDIYLIYDVMGRKEDISAIKEADETFKKQFEMIVIILQSLCRTLLSAGDPGEIRKQRSHLYRNLAGLLSWINGEDPGKTRLSPSCKSPTVLKTDGDLEVTYDSTFTAKFRRNHRRSIMTTSPRSKGSVDFTYLPPLS